MFIENIIWELEENLGCTLFNRSNKGINLTTEGKCFYEYVKLALQIRIHLVLKRNGL